MDTIIGNEDDNLQLAYNPPCIGTGDNTAVPTDTIDLDGDVDFIDFALLHTCSIELIND